MRLAFKFVLSCTKFEANMASCLSEEVKDVILLHSVIILFKNACYVTTKKLDSIMSIYAPMFSLADETVVLYLQHQVTDLL